MKAASSPMMGPLKAVSLFVLLCVLTSFALLPMFSSLRAPSDHGLPRHLHQQPELPHGSLHPLLFDQHLSHHTAHTSQFWQYFLSLLVPKTVVITGVEWGADAVNFAKAGFRVHAVEPGEGYVQKLRRRLQQNPRWDIILHPYAATDESNATLAIKYHGQVVASKVRTRRLDDLVHERVALLSADVQGGELQILRGASGLLPHMVDSVLVELGRCRATNVALLRLLDADYVLFDFVPWGHHRETRNETVSDVRNYGVDESRPGEFVRFDEWLCAKRGEFHWMQTDVLAVRRDLIAGIWGKLAGIAASRCGRTEGMCTLRSLLATKENSNGG